MNKYVVASIIALLAVSTAFGQIKVVAPDGNVGIGVDNPAQKLEVNGNIQLSANAVRTVSGSDNGYNFLMSTGPTYLTSLAGFQMNGNGIANPNNHGNFILVGSNINIRANKTDGGTGISTLWVDKSRKVSIAGGIPSHTLDVNGDIGHMGLVNTSDRRLKKNVRQYNGGLEEVLKINPVFFQYNDVIDHSSDRVQLGVIAQELQEVAPYAVSEFTYKELDADNNVVKAKEKEYLQIQSDAIQYMLVNAVKEQNALIQKQQELIVQLQEDIEDIKSSMEDMSYGELHINGEDDVKFSQNRPNPFQLATVIDYNIGSNFSAATLNVYDAQGNFIKNYEIEGLGKGSVKVTLDNMPDGVYSYSIIADNQVIDTKQMILQK